MTPKLIAVLAMLSVQAASQEQGEATIGASGVVRTHDRAALLATAPFKNPTLERVSPFTAKTEVVGGRGLAGYRDIDGLALDRATNTLYGVSHSEVVVFDPKTGAATPIECVGDRLERIDFDPVTGTIVGQELEPGYVSIDPSTGVMTYMGIGTWTMSGGLAFHPFTNALYGVASVSFNDYLFVIDPHTGSELAVGGSTLDHRPSSIAFDPGTGVLYGINATELFTIDVTTGQSALVANHNTPIVGLTFDAEQGALIGAGRFAQTFFAIDPSTGQVTELGKYGLRDVRGTAFDASTGTLWGVDGATLLAIDEATGAWEVIGADGGGWTLACLAVDPATATLFSVRDATQELVALDPLTGNQSVVAPTGAGKIEALAFDPWNGLLFASDTQSGELLTVDPQGGAASAVGAIGHSAVEGLTLDAATGTLFGVRNELDGDLLRIDTATGAGARLGTVGPHLQSLAFDSQAGGLLGTDRDQDLLRIDPATGSGRTVGALGFASVEGLAYDSLTRVLFGSDTQVDYLVGIDPRTGEGTAMGRLGFTSVTGLAFDAESGTLYGIDDATDQLLKIDRNTGAGQAIATLPGSMIRGLAFDPEAGVLYGSNSFPAELWRIDPATGTSLVIGSLNFAAVRGLALHPRTGDLYGVRWKRRELVVFDKTTAQGSLVGHLLHNPEGLAPLPARRESPAGFQLK